MAIITGVLDPLTQFALDNSQAGVNNTTNPVLIVGQVLNANPQPFALYACTSIAQARAYAGRGSMLSRTFEAYFANDQIGPIYLLPLADAGGATSATGAFAFAGTATANGTVFAYIGGQLVQVGVTSGMTAAQVATAMVAAITAQPDLRCSGAAAAGTVTVTCKNGGTIGNWIPLGLNYQALGQGQTLPAGLTCAVTAMTGGATDPSFASIGALLGNTAMRLIVHGYGRNSTAMAAFATLMNSSAGRWSPLSGAMGHCFTAAQDTVANLTTYGPTNNDAHTSVFAYEMGAQTPMDEAAGIWAGAQASTFRSQPNAPTTGNVLVGFSAPPAGLAEASGGQFMKTTRNTLLGLGLGVARYVAGVGEVSRAPTTYQLNTFGQPDQSYFDTQTMFTLMRIQDFISGWETQVFANTLVADNGTKFGPGIKYTTPALFLAGMTDLYMQMQFAGLVEDAQPFIAASMVSRNLAYPGELDVLWAPYLVSGLYQITNTIQFRMYSAAAAAAAGAAATT